MSRGSSVRSASARCFPMPNLVVWMEMTTKTRNSSWKRTSQCQHTLATASLMREKKEVRYPRQGENGVVEADLAAHVLFAPQTQAHEDEGDDGAHHHADGHRRAVVVSHCKG